VRALRLKKSSPERGGASGNDWESGEKNDETESRTRDSVEGFSVGSSTCEKRFGSGNREV
jgi:hypothetical protein